MIDARIDDRTAAPAWAALGAPLIGIPVLVGLLALAAPERPPAEPDATVVVTIGQAAVAPVAHEAHDCEAEDQAST